MITLFRKTPPEVLDYDGDWTGILDEDETISSSNWEAPGLTITSSSNTDTTVKVWLSGGEDGGTYTVTNTITTSGGRTHQGWFRMQVRRAGTGA